MGLFSLRPVCPGPSCPNSLSVDKVSSPVVFFSLCPTHPQSIMIMVVDGLIRIFTFSLTSQGCIQKSSVCAPTAGDLFLVCSFLGRTKTAAGARGNFPDHSMFIPVVDIQVCVAWMRSLTHYILL